jgi:hypothetical protein
MVESLMKNENRDIFSVDLNRFSRLGDSQLSIREDKDNIVGTNYDVTTPRKEKDTFGVKFSTLSVPPKSHRDTSQGSKKKIRLEELKQELGGKKPLDDKAMKSKSNPRAAYNPSTYHFTKE